MFAGGWTIAAAKVVCAGDAIADDDVVYLLIALIEKSLVVADEDGDRYRMLETVREFAREKLSASDAAELVRERHRDCFLALAEEAEPKLIREEQAEWLQRLDIENENLRAGLRWSLVEPGSTHGGLRLCGALQRFWWSRGHLSEGRDWCRRMLDKAGAGEPTKERAKTLNGAGGIAYLQGDYPAARKLHEESLAIQRQLGDRKGVAAALNNLGSVARDVGDLASARAQFEESLSIGREMGDRWYVANVLGNLGIVAHEQGDYQPARALHEESLALLRELGDQWAHRDFAWATWGGWPTINATIRLHVRCTRRVWPSHGKSGNAWACPARSMRWGAWLAMRATADTARTLFQEGLAIVRELGDMRGIADSMEGLAAVDAASAIRCAAARVWGVGSETARGDRIAAATQ